MNNQASFVIGISGVLLGSWSVSACSAPRGSAEAGTAVSSDGLRQVATDLAVPPEANRLYVISSRNGAIAAQILDPLPAEYKSAGPLVPKHTPASASVGATSTLNSLLESDIAYAEATGAADAVIEVVITFKETLALPHFPPLLPEPRETAANREILGERQRLVGQIEAARAPEYTQLAEELTTNHRAKVKETFWLVDGLVADLPLSEVRAIASLPEVQYVEATEKGASLPAGDSLDARTLMDSDPWYPYEGSGFIGLIDSGVRASHQWLLGHINVAGDCYHGTDIYCSHGSNWNPTDTCDHGTSSASELTATSNGGDANRGITPIWVDSWKMSNDYCGTSVTAIVRAYQAASWYGDGFLVVEAQDPSSPTGMVSAATDNVYDMFGIPIFAPAGNSGMNGPGSVTAPGNARKALTVGAVDVTSQVLDPESGLGPTLDGRTKPDILGPTNVTAASGMSDIASHTFTGTSAANPNAAGLISGIWSTFGGGIPAGFMYATALTLGSNAYGAAYDNTNGAGLVRWVDGADIWSSSESVSGNSTVDVPITVSYPQQYIDAAIWWPESATGGHNDLDLYVLDPSGVIRASSTSSGSVFEKGRAPGGSAGTWTLRIVGYSVTGSQLVYWGWSAKY